MLFQGNYEAEQRARLFDLGREARCSVFLDIGANFGLYSVHAALNGRFGSIHAFEPDPRNLACLRANLHLNGRLGQVIVHEIALSAEDGAVWFAGGGDAFTGQSRIVQPETRGSTEISARRLDSILQSESGLCIKMDVEGHEMSVLEGARGLLEGQTWVIQVECLGESGDRVGEFIGDLGGTHRGQIGDDHYYVRQ
jgi:FkbM family methyltransferase